MRQPQITGCAMKGTNLSNSCATHSMTFFVGVFFHTHDTSSDSLAASLCPMHFIAFETKKPAPRCSPSNRQFALNLVQRHIGATVPTAPTGPSILRFPMAPITSQKQMGGTLCQNQGFCVSNKFDFDLWLLCLICSPLLLTHCEFPSLSKLFSAQALNLFSLFAQ